MTARHSKQNEKTQPAGQSDSTDTVGTRPLNSASTTAAIIHTTPTLPRASPAAPPGGRGPMNCVFSSAMSIFGHYTLLDSFDMSGIDQLSTASLDMTPTALPETPRLTSKSTLTSNGNDSAGNLIINSGKLPSSPNGNKTSRVDQIPVNRQEEDSSGWQSPLHIAAQRGHDRIVRILLQHQSDCNERDGNGLTPLFHAIIGGHEDVSSVLLEHGARIGMKDRQGRTALALAVVHRREALLKILLQNCAGNQTLIDGYDAAGLAPLHTAIEIGFEAGVRLLLEHGANLNNTRKSR
ncbi:hypothetical protein E0Z10_g10197 [Xylaria hypoxylon]|uniref:Uncharacterized protein n=1 Tax=Xylaria hypoxylon TaxID=37992 RepID=A0A4Z0Y3L4_9PEZI|nr:hypothetical protein E0Z10_g10197 [Xylaria hypoxylon]